MARRTVPRVVRGTVKYEVVSNRQSFDGRLEVGGRRMRLKRRGGNYIYDPALARDIDQKYGFGKRGSRDVVVCHVDNEDPVRESGHRYSFSMPEMPWKRKRRKGA